MSQISAPAPGPRPASGGDAPEVMYILKHYKWLIVIGTLLGVLIGISAFVLCKRFYPRYTAYALFKVRQPAPPLVDATGYTVAPYAWNNEQIVREIRGNAELIKQISFLENVVQRPAFKEAGVEAWMRHVPTLRDELEISQVPNSDYFRLSLTGKNPRVVREIVQTIASEYNEAAILRSRERMSKELSDLGKAVVELEREVSTQTQNLELRRQSNQIPALAQAHGQLVSTAGILNVERMKAVAALTAAKSYRDNIAQGISSSTLQLTPEMEKFVEDDWSVRSLESNRLGLEQERAAALLKYEKDHAVIKAIEARMDEIAKQAATAREKLRNQARLLMQERANSAVNTAEAQVKELDQQSQEMELKIKDLDRALVAYNNDVESLKNKQRLLDDLKRRQAVERLRTDRDDVRVEMQGNVSVPQADDMSFPRLKYFLPAGLFGGFALAFGLGYLLELTNTRVRTPRDITRTMQLPLLGFVPDQDDDRFVNGDLATSIRTSPASMIAESFRQIRSRLAAAVDGRTVNTLLVASVSPGGGATTVASNLANGIALNGQRVLLVDANFYRPGLRANYKNIPAVGFSDVLENLEKLDQAVVPAAELPGLHVMGSGSKAATAASELLGSKAFPMALVALKSKYDVVIFDGAPLNLVSDALTIAAKVDGVIGVVRAGVITRGTVGRVRDQLRQVKANLLGFVLNAAQTRGSGYFKENYRTFFNYAATAPTARVPQPTTKH